MFHIKYKLTTEQIKEYKKLKKDRPKMSELDLFITITGGIIFIGKALSHHLGLLEISKIFINSSEVFFWIVIVISIIKGIKKNFNRKTRLSGISQIVGSGISAFLMLR